MLSPAVTPKQAKKRAQPLRRGPHSLAAQHEPEAGSEDRHLSRGARHPGKTLIPLVLALSFVLPVAAGEEEVNRARRTPPAFQVNAQFQITAERFFLKAHREVFVAVSVDGLAGVVSVNLDSPVTPCGGIDRATIRMHILNESLHEIGVIAVNVPMASSSFNFPLRFPATGRYRLTIGANDIEIGKAKVSIHPLDQVTLDVLAGGTTS